MAMLCSPEGAIYTNDGYNPSDKNKNTITSPEGAQLVLWYRHQ